MAFSPQPPVLNASQGQRLRWWKSALIRSAQQLADGAPKRVLILMVQGAKTANNHGLFERGEDRFYRRGLEQAGSDPSIQPNLTIRRGRAKLTGDRLQDHVGLEAVVVSTAD